MGGEPHTSRFQANMDTGMARMMQAMHSPGYTGQPDSDFLAMMIPNHEGAVDMARLVLIHWARPDGAANRRSDHCQPEGRDRRDARADGGFARGAESGAGRVSGCGGCAGWGLNEWNSMTGRSASARLSSVCRRSAEPSVNSCLPSIMSVSCL